jgi:hypothetical protein
VNEKSKFAKKAKENTTGTLEPTIDYATWITGVAMLLAALLLSSALGIFPLSSFGF